VTEDDSRAADGPLPTLAGRTVLVTGATRGLGHGYALATMCIGVGQGIAVIIERV
jgi:acetyl-CoA acetyltransferase